jgi:hypothetical protein
VIENVVVSSPSYRFDFSLPRAPATERRTLATRALPCDPPACVTRSVCADTEPCRVGLSAAAPRLVVVMGLPRFWGGAAAPATVGATAGGDGAELRYSVPESLTTFKVEAKIETKALTLVALLDDLAGQATICFTACACFLARSLARSRVSVARAWPHHWAAGCARQLGSVARLQLPQRSSIGHQMPLPAPSWVPMQHLTGLGGGAAAAVESTHRLFLILAAVEALPVHVVEYSSHQTQGERSAALSAFKAATVAGRGVVMVASDAMTRGMDIKVRLWVEPETQGERASRVEPRHGGGDTHTADALPSPGMDIKVRLWVEPETQGERASRVEPRHGGGDTNTADALPSPGMDIKVRLWVEPETQGERASRVEPRHGGGDTHTADALRSPGMDIKVRLWVEPETQGERASRVEATRTQLMRSAHPPCAVCCVTPRHCISGGTVVRTPSAGGEQRGELRRAHVRQDVRAPRGPHGSRGRHWPRLHAAVPAGGGALQAHAGQGGRRRRAGGRRAGTASNSRES